MINGESLSGMVNKRGSLAPAGDHMPDTRFPEDLHTIHGRHSETPANAGGSVEDVVRGYTSRPRHATLEQIRKSVDDVRKDAQAPAPPVAEIAPQPQDESLSPWHGKDLFEATKAATGITFGDEKPEEREQ